MSLKIKINDLCKLIANDYEGWAYVAGAFKNKHLKFCHLIVDPFWSYASGGALCQPVAGVYIPKLEKLWELTESGYKNRYSLGEKLNKPGEDLITFRKYINNIDEDHGEAYIRQVLDLGIELINQRYDLTSEEALLKNLPDLPSLYEDDLGVTYCLAHILSGDFDFFLRFYNDEISTIRPKKMDKLERIMAHLPELQANWEKTGKVA